MGSHVLSVAGGSVASDMSRLDSTEMVGGAGRNVSMDTIRAEQDLSHMVDDLKGYSDQEDEHSMHHMKNESRSRHRKAHL